MSWLPSPAWYERTTASRSASPASRGKVEPKGVVKALDAGQRKDGGFGKEKVEESDLETSYRVMRTYHMLKAKPARVADLKAFVARCRNKDGGYAVVPGGASSASGTYFAGIILYWLDQK